MADPARLARGSDALANRPTCAMHKDELRGLLQQTGGLDAEIEVVAQREPAAVIVDRPAPEVQVHQRPTCAIDPEALRALVQPAVLPVYHAQTPRWPWLVALLAAATVLALLIV